MNDLVLGVVGTSKKTDERRFPIHPEHLRRVPEDIRRQLAFEKGHGEPFGIVDSEIAAQSGGVTSRHELLADIGSVIVCKPVLADQRSRHYRERNLSGDDKPYPVRD